MPLPVAILGPSGRTHATVAALLLACGLARSAPAELLRVRLPGDPELPPASNRIPDVFLTDKAVPDAAAAATLVHERLDQGVDKRLVLDLPVSLGEVAHLRDRIGLTILAVGPSPLDETAAVDAAVRLAGAGHGPAWLLGCDRSGGVSAGLIFTADVAAQFAAKDHAEGRVVPAVLPVLAPIHVSWLMTGVPEQRTDDIAKALAQIVDLVRSDPAAAYAAIPDSALALDDRPPEDRLRALADDLDAIAQGRGPTPRDLDHAPVLDDWSYETAPRRVIAGTVISGHPTVKAGNRITTSELFASDGKGFARTLNRWYRLRDRRAA